MANSDDVRRVLVACEACGSGYAGYRWPDGTLQPIGTDECSCGSAVFMLVDDSAGDEPGDEPDRESTPDES